MNNKELEEWAWGFIETWIRIDIKDTEVVKQAKMDARKEFVKSIQSLLNQAELRARYDELLTSCVGRGYGKEDLELALKVGLLKEQDVNRIKTLESQMEKTKS